MKLATARRWSLVGLAAFSVALIAGSFDGLPLFRHLSGKYLGYFCLALAILGAMGVNVWIGGPLDLRRDEEQEPPA